MELKLDSYYRFFGFPIILIHNRVTKNVPYAMINLARWEVTW